MRIKFNDFESLEIAIKTSYDFDEFHQLVQRFIQIDKLGRKDFMVDSSLEGTYENKEPNPSNLQSNDVQYFKNGKMKKSSLKNKKVISSEHKIITTRKLNTREWCSTKEKTIKVLKLHYLGTLQKKEEFAKQNNTPWLNIVKSIGNIRDRWNIKPEEVGLKYFPQRMGKENIAQYRL